MRSFASRGVYLAALLALSPTSARADDKPEIKWFKSFKESLAEAKKDNKLVMVDVYTTWCGPCKMLEKETYVDGAVVKRMSSIVSCKLDAEDEKEGTETAKKYKVNAYPTILFVDAAGEVAGKIVGFKKPKEFVEAVTKIETAFKELPGLLEKIKANPNDVTTLLKLVSAMSARGDSEKAVKYLEDADKAGGGEELGQAYNDVADTFQEDEKFDKAISLFQKAFDKSKSGKIRGYARMSIATCYMQSGRLEKAKEEFQASLKIEGISDEDKTAGEQSIAKIEQFEAKRKEAAEKAKAKAKEKEEKKDDKSDN